jgi:hypothetical protein
VCDCKSYNLNIGEIKEAVLEVPKHMQGILHKKTVCVDNCIAGSIRKLWENKITTLGCCCGHNIKAPSVIISDVYNKYEEYMFIQNLLKIYDGRNWDVLQWKLTKVNL